MNKKAIFFILIFALALVILFLIFQKSKDSCSEMNWDNTFCTDNLMELEDQIGEYQLFSSIENYECINLEDSEVLCLKSVEGTYRSENKNLQIGVKADYVDKGNINSLFNKGFETGMLKKTQPITNLYYIKDSTSPKNDSVVWKTDESFDTFSILVQTYHPTESGGESFGFVDNIDFNNDVVNYYLNKYPPVSLED